MSSHEFAWFAYFSISPLKRELERRRIKSSRKSRLSADSEESFDDSDLRLRSITSGSTGGGSNSSKRRQRRFRRPEETHF